MNEVTERYTHIPMTGEDKEWVVALLEGEAATNWKGLQDVDHWLVVEHTGGTEVYEVIGTPTPEQAYEMRDTQEGFPMGDDTYEDVVSYIEGYGFPIHNFE